VTGATPSSSAISEVLDERSSLSTTSHSRVVRETRPLSAVEQPRHELARHRGLTAESPAHDVREARGIEALAQVAARAGTYGGHELVLVEPAGEQDDGGRRNSGDDLVQRLQPLARGIEAQQADVGTITHSRVHGRPGVRGFAAACLRLERQAEPDARRQALRRDEDVRAPLGSRGAHELVTSTGPPTTIAACEFSSQTIIVSLSKA
jgi:hypothetical protein